MKICKMEQNYPKVQNQTFGMNLKVRTIDEETVDGVLSAFDLRKALNENAGLRDVYKKLEQGLSKIHDNTTLYAVDSSVCHDEFELAYSTRDGDTPLSSSPSFFQGTTDSDIESFLKTLPTLVNRYKGLFG